MFSRIDNMIMILQSFSFAHAAALNKRDSNNDVFMGLLSAIVLQRGQGKPKINGSKKTHPP